MVFLVYINFRTGGGCLFFYFRRNLQKEDFFIILVSEDFLAFLGREFVLTTINNALFPGRNVPSGPAEAPLEGTQA